MRRTQPPARFRIFVRTESLSNAAHHLRSAVISLLICPVGVFVTSEAQVPMEVKAPVRTTCSAMTKKCNLSQEKHAVPTLLLVHWGQRSRL